MGAQVVSFRCVLKNRVGQILSSTVNQDVITFSEGQEQILKGLANGLKNLTKGEKRQIRLPAEQAYGFYDLALVIRRTRSQIVGGGALRVGDEVPHPSWEGRPRVFRVVQTDGQSLVLDGNHPFAGEDLIFEIEATEARDATPGELAESRTSVGEPLLH